MLPQVNFQPYVFECFLYADVHDLKSAAEIGNGTAIFKLEKVKEEIWPTLQNAEAGLIKLSAHKKVLFFTLHVTYLLTYSLTHSLNACLGDSSIFNLAKFVLCKGG